MRTATGLALVALGAILAFAVTRQTSFINIHIAGWVLIATGAAGLIIPRRGAGWRRVIVRRGHNGNGVDQDGQRPMLRLGGRMLHRPSGPGIAPPEPDPPEPAGAPTRVIPGQAEQTVEEYFEE